MRATAFPFYYGWAVLAAGAVTEMLAQGATSYAAGLFVLPLQGEFHISRAAANSSILILFLGSALAAPFVGKMLDRYSIRLAISLGAIIFSLSFVAIALTTSLGVMAAVLFLPAAIGFMALGPLTTATLASRWFYKRRGLALGIAAVATSGGGFVVVPLLSKAIQLYGWRQALLYEAVVMCVVIIALALFVLRDSPFAAGLGEHPENDGRHQPQAGAASASLRWRDILGRSAFWIPSLTLATISGTCQAIVITLVPYGIGLGFAAASAALLISAFSIAAALTKVLAGVLADHLNQRYLLIAGLFCMMLSMLALRFFTGYDAVLAASCLAGIALGFALPITAALIAADFGAAVFGTVMGSTYAAVLCFAIVETLFIGAVYDKTHSYQFAFTTFLVLATAMLAATGFFGRKPRAA